MNDAPCSPVQSLQERVGSSPHCRRDARVLAFQLAEAAISQNLFADILRLLAELRPTPVTSTA
jgi:hypothetical protein